MTAEIGFTAGDVDTSRTRQTTGTALMDAKQFHDKSPPSMEMLLEQFELAWQSGAPPDLAQYLPKPHSRDREYLRCLIEIDLEYRWRRFRDDSDRASVDHNGFPKFSKLEAYVELESVIADEILTADLIAEEYRVRTRWGDRPDRREYLTRFDIPASELLAAIEKVEAECKIESTSPCPGDEADHSSRSQANASTVTYPTDELSAKRFSKSNVVPKHLDHYRLDSVVGRGGFGEVWKAYDTKLKADVAVKVPRPDRIFSRRILDDFKKEGEKLAGIRDIEGVVTVYAAGECNGCPYLVSSLIEGEDLAKRLKRAPLSHAETAELIAQVADILHRAHKKNLVHRDIKPHNILLDKDGKPYLTDFGLAITELEQLREDPAVLGTYAYMSPEQAAGQSHLANPQSDIYSLGVVLYQSLSKRLPFVAEKRDDYKIQILNRPARPPRTVDDEIPQELERICLKCLEKEPVSRYATAADLADDLRKESKRAMNPAPKPLAVSRSFRSWGLVLSMVALCCFAVIVAIYGTDWFRRAPEPPVPELANLPFQKLEDDDLETFKPYSLLQVKPITIVGPDGPGDGKHFDDTTELLQIASQSGALLQLGKVERESYTIRVDIKQAGPWKGHAGLVIGLPENGATRRGQMIVLSKNLGANGSKFPIIAARYHIDVIDAFKSDSYFRREYPPSDVPNTCQAKGFAAGRLFQLEIQVVRKRLTSVRWAGQDLPILGAKVLNNCFPANSYVGSFGLVAWHTPGVTFQNAEITISAE